MADLTPEKIEELRRSGIRLDREGRLWHEGQQVTHERFQAALRLWLDKLPDGRTILRLDEKRYAYVEVDDAHLLVTSLQWQGDTAILKLNDGTSEELAYETLVQGADSAMYCTVRKGVLSARFLTQAYYQLATHIDETGDTGSTRETFALRARGNLYPIGERTSIASC